MSFRDLIARGPRIDTVETPEGAYHVRVLTGAERSALEKEWTPYEGDDFAALLIARTVCDKDGAREFEGMAAAEAIAEVLKAPAMVNLALARKAWEVNRLGKAGVEQEKNG